MKQHGLLDPPPSVVRDMRSDQERGSVLIVVILMMVTVAALVTAHLTIIIAEQKKIEKRHHAQQAMAMALGEIERARNVVNSAVYTAGQNDALLAAVSATPPMIAGTQVEVYQVPGSLQSPWYRLRVAIDVHGVKKMAQIFCRDVKPVSGYNLLCVKHPVGISGAPLGTIHSNDKVEFYFPDGKFVDSVTAVNGFEYAAGATKANTHLLGDSNPHAEVKNPFADTKASDLAEKATTIKVVDDLIAKLTFKGKKTQVDLYAKGETIKIKKLGYKEVIVSYKKEAYTEEVERYKTVKVPKEVTKYKDRVWYEDKKVKVYKYDKVTKYKTVNVYKTETKKVKTTEKYISGYKNVTKSKQVWVPSSGGGAVSGGGNVMGGGSSSGYYKTETWTEKQPIWKTREVWVDKKVKVKIGTKQEPYTETVKTWTGKYEIKKKKRTEKVPDGTEIKMVDEKVFSHVEKVTKYKDVPVMGDVPYTYDAEYDLAGEKVETRIVDTTGLMYFAGRIDSMKGDVNGKVTVATNDKVRITDSIVYVDDDGDQRMNNGLKKSKKYEANPDYDGNSMLGVIADGDIHYAVESPKKLEVNASLVSLRGGVGFEVIGVNESGTQAFLTMDEGQAGHSFLKDLLSRLGGITSYTRPIDTLIDGNNNLVAGFAAGRSQMDRNMMLEAGGSAPPGMLSINQPTWALRSVGTMFTSHNGTVQSKSIKTQIKSIKAPNVKDPNSTGQQSNTRTKR